MSGTPVSWRLVNIDETSAEAIGTGTIESQTDIRNICSSSNHGVVSFQPQLVERQFADGQTRLAWVYGEGCITDKIYMSAKAEFVYLDAATGAPLLLIKDMFAGDPSFTCLPLSPMTPPHYQQIVQGVQRLFVGVGITVAYLVAVITVALVLRRRRKAQALLNP